jgi:hypothetical protein
MAAFNIRVPDIPRCRKQCTPTRSQRRFRRGTAVTVAGAQSAGAGAGAGAARPAAPPAAPRAAMPLEAKAGAYIGVTFQLNLSRV